MCYVRQRQGRLLVRAPIPSPINREQSARIVDLTEPGRKGRSGVRARHQQREVRWNDRRHHAQGSSSPSGSPTPPSTLRASTVTDRRSTIPHSCRTRRAPTSWVARPNPEFIPGLVRLRSDARRTAVCIQQPTPPSSSRRPTSRMTSKRAMRRSSSGFASITTTAGPRGAAQPRLGVSYPGRRADTVLRASYGRTMETPYNENLLLSSGY